MKIALDMYGRAVKVETDNSSHSDEVLNNIMDYYPYAKEGRFQIAGKKMHQVLTVNCIADFRIHNCPQDELYEFHPSEVPEIDYELRAPMMCMTCPYSITYMWNRPFNRINRGRVEGKRKLGFRTYFGAWLQHAFNQIISLTRSNATMSEDMKVLEAGLAQISEFEAVAYVSDKDAKTQYHQ